MEAYISIVSEVSLTPAEQAKEFLIRHNMRHSILIEGNELVCNSCGSYFNMDSEWGATLLDHSMNENTYIVRSYCKRCWWIESTMQTDVNRAIHVNEDRASEERRKRR